MGVVNVDVSQVRRLAARLGSVPERKRALVSDAVGHGARNIKAAIRADLSGSSDRAFRSIPIAYEMHGSGTIVEADIAPVRGGAGSLANIAFFGTSRGGGGHEFYEHGIRELDETARYVKEAASTL